MSKDETTETEGYALLSVDNVMKQRDCDVILGKCSVLLCDDPSDRSEAGYNKWIVVKITTTLEYFKSVEQRIADEIKHGFEQRAFSNMSCTFVPYSRFYLTNQLNSINSVLEEIAQYDGLFRPDEVAKINLVEDTLLEINKRHQEEDTNNRM